MVYLENIKAFKDVDTCDKFSDIIINNPVSKNEKKDYSLSSHDSVHLIKRYLVNIDEEYYNEFLSMLKKRKLAFKRHFPSQFVYIRNKVFIDYTETLDDTLAIIHEFMHYMAYKQNKKEEAKPLGEINSITNEFLLADYLYNKANLFSIKNQMHKNLYSNMAMAKDAKLETELHRIVGDTKAIVLSRLPDNLKEYVTSLERRRFKNNLYDYGLYLIGNIFAIYIHQNMLDKNLTKEDYKKIRELLINENSKDLSSLLDLDFSLDKVGLEISDSSIKKLEKTYQKEVKFYE